MMNVKITIEVRPRVQACSVVLWSPQQGATLQLTVHQQSLTAVWTSDSQLICEQRATLPEELPLKLQPCSLTSLVQEEETVSFRLQTEPKCASSGSFCAEVIMGGKSSSLPVAPKPCISVNKMCRVECLCCKKNILVCDVRFQRILPLPSLSGSLEDFFCHQHETQSRSIDNAIHCHLEPKELDLFYTGHTFHINRSLVDSSDKVIRCKRCLAWLGTSEGNKVCLWNCTATLLETNNIVSQSVAPNPAREFLALVSESSSTPNGFVNRMLFEVKIDGHNIHYLLLWVIDQDLLLLTASSHSDCELTHHTALKVQYAFSKTKSDVVIKWLADTRVNALEVAFPIFFQGLKLLTTSSQMIPSLCRKVQDDFLLAYLCADFID